MHALIDADILRYEVGFASEVGWKNGDFPPWEYTQEMLEMRLDRIMQGAGATNSTLFLTEGPTFRYDLATVKPYKGNREDHRPWHFDNLTVYMRDVLGAEVVAGIEADDAMAIEQTRVETEDAMAKRTIICTRDKDLRQVPGWHYGWEMGAQPEFGPVLVTQEGDGLALNSKRNAIVGTGLPFFYSQVLTGDRADNIPGLPGCGAVAAYAALVDNPNPEQTVIYMYEEYYGYHEDEWEERLLEQGRLCWMTRRLHPDGKPVLWEIGMES